MLSNKPLERTGSAGRSTPDRWTDHLETPMKQDVARSVLRILGIATTLVGAILTTQALIARMAVSEALSAAPAGMQVRATGMLGEMGSYAIVAQAVTLGFGVAVFYLSPVLARHVVE